MGIHLNNLTERRKSAIIVGLSGLAALFAIVGVVRHDLFSMASLGAKRDSLTALQAVVTMATLVAASVVSYYRFFRGRTFSIRADLTVACKVVPLDDTSVLHAVTFTVRNVGTMAIWGPVPQMRVELEGSGPKRSYEITDWLDDKMIRTSGTKCVIDAGEIALFFVRHHVDRRVPAVTYVASVTSEDGDSWITGATFSNQIAD